MGEHIFPATQGQHFADDVGATDGVQGLGRDLIEDSQRIGVCVAFGELRDTGLEICGGLFGGFRMTRQHSQVAK